MAKETQQNQEKEQETVNIIVQVPAELHRKLRHWCIDESLSLKDWIINSIKALPDNR